LITPRSGRNAAFIVFSLEVLVERQLARKVSRSEAANKARTTSGFCKAGTEEP
jgi:hypothetical protein